jgi:hypothetical protein
VGIIVKSKRPEDEREPIPPGNYLGVIIGLYDIGTQDGQYGKKHQVITLTELHKKKRGPAVDSKGRIHTISTFYALTFNSMNGRKSKLRADVETITGHIFTEEQAERDGFDVQELVGLSYQLTLVESVKPDGKKMAKIASIMRLDEDDPKPESQADEVYYELDPKEPIPSAVPKWIAKFIERSEEWVAVHGKPKDNGTNGSAPSLPPPGTVDESDDDRAY